ncbi:MAG: N-acetylmuramoyl-L-alanine amidase [Parvularculaceae bacterium]|nr:N-acetylmuramoyl-L-alanine amidase [Parvularculaceae bacterium]
MFAIFELNIKALCAALAIMLGWVASAHAAEISAVRLGLPTPGATRIVIDADAAFAHRIAVEDRGAGRLVLQLQGVSPAKGFSSTGEGLGHIADFVALSPGAGAINVVLDLKKTAKIKDVFEIPPSGREKRHRLVVDLVNGSTAEMLASASAPEFAVMEDVIAAATPENAQRQETTALEESVSDAARTTTTVVEVIATPAPEAQKTAGVLEVPAPSIAPHATSRVKPVIVIDAGHGGSDPGASGPDGLQESEVTLAAAKALETALKATGRYEVVLTRISDVRLAHEERSRIARDANAGLFLSIHADAHDNPKIRGGSVYTLSEKGTARSAREALSKDNYVIDNYDVAKAEPALATTLYEVMQRESGTKSDKFAEILIAKLDGVTPLLNNTHRRENFKVLLAPDVPAILLELAFISNKSDEANLKSPAWRKRTMAAVADAIDTYFTSVSPVRHASSDSSR